MDPALCFPAGTKHPQGQPGLALAQFPPSLGSQEPSQEQKGFLSTVLLCSGPQITPKARAEQEAALAQQDGKSTGQTHGEQHKCSVGAEPRQQQSPECSLLAHHSQRCQAKEGEISPSPDNNTGEQGKQQPCSCRDYCSLSLVPGRWKVINSSCFLFFLIKTLAFSSDKTHKAKPAAFPPGKSCQDSPVGIYHLFCHKIQVIPVISKAQGLILVINGINEALQLN